MENFSGVSQSCVVFNRCPVAALCSACYSRLFPFLSAPAATAAAESHSLPASLLPFSQLSLPKRTNKHSLTHLPPISSCCTFPASLRRRLPCFIKHSCFSQKILVQVRRNKPFSIPFSTFFLKVRKLIKPSS